MNQPIDSVEELVDALNTEHFAAAMMQLDHHPELMSARLSPTGETFLHWAVRAENEAIGTELLRRGADPNILSDSLQTALHLAIDLVHIPTILWLLKWPLDVSIENALGMSALHLFASRCYAIPIDEGRAILDALFERGADATAIDRDGKTALHWVSRPEGAWVIKALVEHGVDPNVVDRKGWTPLFQATLLPEIGGPLIEALLDAGAAVDVRNPRLNSTPLLNASHYSDMHYCRLLLRAGASIDAKDSLGFGVLHHMTSRASVEGVRELVELGADLNAIDICGETPLMLACRMGLPAIVRVLLELGADRWITDEDGATAFEFAEHIVDPDTRFEIEAELSGL